VSTGRKYSKGEIGKLRIAEDFLPAPHKLVPRVDRLHDSRRSSG
jgi:hypothetical protein